METNLPSTEIPGLWSNPRSPKSLLMVYSHPLDQSDLSQLGSDLELAQQSDIFSEPLVMDYPAYQVPSWGTQESSYDEEQHDRTPQTLPPYVYVLRW